MGIQITFNTEELSTEDIAVLNAMARSLADPDWATTEDAPKRRASTRRAPAKAASTRRAPAKAAAAPKAEEKPEDSTLKVVKTDADKKEPAPEPEEPAEEPKKAPAKAAAPKEAPKPAEPAPEPEEAPSEAPDEDDEAEAVRLATALVHDGRGAEVREALKAVDAKKVSDLKGESLSGFLAAVREL